MQGMAVIVSKLFYNFIGNVKNNNKGIAQKEKCERVRKSPCKAPPL
jgi:hypothetical protein